MFSETSFFYSLFTSTNGYTVGVMAAKAIPLGIAKTVHNDPLFHKHNYKYTYNQFII